ncbi:hypothetical protein HDU98_000361 [Podochytrium sp. JEL0797]|nr:hypothetical protein HDU98_000361 [Podochytrium sp. JEL0797]
MPDSNTRATKPVQRKSPSFNQFLHTFHSNEQSRFDHYWRLAVKGPHLPTPKTLRPRDSRDNVFRHDVLPIPKRISDSPRDLARFLHSDIILAKSVETPFGIRPLVYADFIASGRPLRCIEKTMMEKVMPYYANTHTETGILGRCMTELRENARTNIKRSCHATEEYGCIFVGSGSTAAINRLAHLIALPQKVSAANLGQGKSDTPVVFISSAEHHSNILVWREMGANVISIPTNSVTGVIKMDVLETQLKLHMASSTLIGSFTAASNIVGILQPVHQLAKLMHKYNGLAFFDYACAGPYVSIEVSPASRPVDEHLDAVMVSPHKFLGGPGTPGLLLIRKSICGGGERPPVVPGGGAVTWVNERGFHAYYADLETREEAGTPDILAAIRAGLVFEIKAMQTPAFIQEKSFHWTRFAASRLSASPNIQVLGSPHAENKLPVFSILVKSPVEGQLLHHHFVSKLLADVFGVQSRSGCSCAAPYLIELLDISAAAEERNRSAFFGSGKITEGFKFGFTRFNLSYTHTQQEVDYILDAVCWVGEYGWKMLPFYEHDLVRGTWTPIVNDTSVLGVTVGRSKKWGGERGFDFKMCARVALFAAKEIPAFLDHVWFLASPGLHLLQPKIQSSRYSRDFSFNSLLQIPKRITNSPVSFVRFLHGDTILAKSVETPFGIRPLVYADFIASGRPLRCIEKTMMEKVMPYYANTHTETGILGRCMTELRENARTIIKRSCNATEEYGCIFVGSGSTAAINRLAHLIGLPQKVSAANLGQGKSDTPVVFISSAEHHSNILVWREMGAKVISIPTNSVTGVIQMDVLETQLQRHASAAVLIGSFTAASNIVGILQPVHQLAKLMHKYNSLAFFDYACAGPYVSIEVSPASRPVDEHLDAVMVSPHKFLGGPGTPGLLLVRKSICGGGERPPVVPGGGAVTWVNERGFHAYYADLETREEAGTPDILAAIRAGVVFEIKAMQTPAFIQEKSFHWTRYAASRLSASPNIQVLGSPHSENKLPVFSILVKSPVEGQLLHHHFVSKLLADVFGVQSRSGCSCAAPYLIELLDISAAAEERNRSAFFGSGKITEGFKFGFTRFNLSYTHTQQEVDYILDAVCWVGEYGWKMLPFYEHDLVRGTWTPIVNDTSVLGVTVGRNKKWGGERGFDFKKCAHVALFAAKEIVKRSDWRERVHSNQQARMGAPNSQLLCWYSSIADVAALIL